jgi:hypothetical protein
MDVLIDECRCVKCESGLSPCDEIASRNAARAELVALRERVAKLEAALAKADELEVTAANVGHCLGCGEFNDCEIHSLFDPRLAYRIAREATK